MASDNSTSSPARVRVWPSGALGVVLVLAGGHLQAVEEECLPGNGVCDPAMPDGLSGPEAARAQLELTRFLARAFGLRSPLFRSPAIFGHTLDQVVSAAALAPRVLDVGCGGPDGPEGRGNKKRRTTGLDVWPASELAHGSQYRQVLSDGTFPVDDAEFDVVRGLFVLEHVADLTLFLREASRVLRPGGLAAMVTTHYPSGAEPRLSLGHFRDFTSVNRNGPGWLVTLEALHACFAAVGLEVESMRGSRLVQPGGSFVWCRLTENYPSVAEQLWIRARRWDAA